MPLPSNFVREFTTLELNRFMGISFTLKLCMGGNSTMGGAKGVDESTISAIFLIMFIADFAFCYCFFQEVTHALKIFVKSSTLVCEVVVG